MKASEIARLVDGELRGDDVEISSIADIRTASDGQLSYFNGTGAMPASGASCLIVGSAAKSPTSDRATIVVNVPKLAFAKAAAVLHPPKRRSPGIHATAVIARDAVVGRDVFIGAYVCVGEESVVGNGTQIRAGAKIGDNVRIGDECVVHPNVFIEDGCTIADRVVLHAGVVIGADGFGYVKDESGSHIKFPQIGTVVIEDDVEIGANTCIDRGALGETRIGAGTKIDNLVQIAHNVRIGRRCVIAAMVGISGSVVIEDDVTLAGQVGVADHVTIKRGVTVGAKSAVFPNKTLTKGFWMGIPARPFDEYKRRYRDHQRDATTD